MKPNFVVLYYREDSGLTFVMSRAQLETVGLTTEAQILEAFPTGKWLKVWTKEPLAPHRDEISRLCQIEDETLGLKYDPTLESQAIAKVLIERFEGADAASVEQMYVTTPLPVIDALDRFLQIWMSPGLGMSQSFFTAASRNKSAESGKTRRRSGGKTSTPA